MPAVLYFSLKYFSFTSIIHLPYSDTLTVTQFIRSFQWRYYRGWLYWGMRNVSALWEGWKQFGSILQFCSSDWPNFLQHSHTLLLSTFYFSIHLIQAITLEMEAVYSVEISEHSSITQWRNPKANHQHIINCNHNLRTY